MAGRPSFNLPGLWRGDQRRHWRRALNSSYLAAFVSSYLAAFVARAPHSGRMRAFPVDGRVGDVQNNDPALFKPVYIGRVNRPPKRSTLRLPRIGGHLC